MFLLILIREVHVRALLPAIFLLIFFSSQALPSSSQTVSPAQTAASKPDSAAGKIMFERHCSLCHGMDGSGGRGPSLLRPKLIHAPDDAALNSLIENGIAPEMPPAWFLTKEEIASLAVYVRSLGTAASEKLLGDPDRGKAIYARSGCTTCHKISGQGSSYGPDLSEVGARRGLAHLRETLRNPSKTLPEDFLLVEAATASGTTVRGIRLNEDTFSIQLKDQQGRFYSFR